MGEAMMLDEAAMYGSGLDAALRDTILRETHLFHHKGHEGHGGAHFQARRLPVTKRIGS